MAKLFTCLGGSFQLRQSTIVYCLICNHIKGTVILYWSYCTTKLIYMVGVLHYLFKGNCLLIVTLLAKVRSLRVLGYQMLYQKIEE